MNKLISLLTCVALAAVSLAGEEPENLLANPEFNEGTRGWGLSGGAIRVETMALSGQWVVRSLGNAYQFMSCAPKGWERDEEYTLAIRARSLGAGSALRIVQMGRNEHGKVQEGTYATGLMAVGPEFHTYYVPFRTQPHLEPTSIAFYKVDSKAPDTGVDIDSVKMFRGKITPFEVRKIGRPGRQAPVAGTEIKPKPSRYGKAATPFRAFVATDNRDGMRAAMNLFAGTGIAYDLVFFTGKGEDVYNTDDNPDEIIERLKTGGYDVYVMSDKVRAKVGPQLEAMMAAGEAKGVKTYSEPLLVELPADRDGLDDFPYREIALAEKVDAIVRLAKGEPKIPANAKVERAGGVYAGERHLVERTVDERGRTLKFTRTVEPVEGPKLGAFSDDGDHITVAIDGYTNGVSLAWKFTDFSGRTLAMGKAEGEPAKFDVPKRKLYTNMGVVKLTLKQDGQTADKRTEAVYARGNDLARVYDDYTPSMWPMGGVAPDVQEMFRQLEGMGMRASQFPTSSGHHWPLSLRSGLACGTGAIAGGYFWLPGKLKSRERVPNVNTMAARRGLRDSTVRQGREFAKYGPIQTFLQDEGEMVRTGTDDEVDNNPENVAAYRRYMARKYGTIEEYNRRHRTNHANFEALDETLLQTARDTGNFAEFVEWRNFNVDRWCEAIRIAGKGVRSTCPDVKYSLLNTFGESAFSGNDYWKLLTHTGVDYSSEYTQLVYFGRNPNSLFDEFYRSFRPDMRVWGYTGYFYTPARATFLPWWSACHRYGGFTWFAATAWGYNLIDMPSYAMTTDGYEMMKSLEASRMLTGLGKVLTCWPWAKRDVALYYSHDSLLVSTCLGKEKRCNEICADGPLHDFMYSRMGVQFLVEDLLYQHDFVAPRQVVDGKLTDEGYRILFMPRILAMSDAEVEAIKAFVKKGGKVVADQMPGDYDELGVKRAKNPFAAREIEVTGKNFDDLDAEQRKWALATLEKAKATRVLGSPTIVSHRGREAMHYVSGKADVYAVIRMPGRASDADEEEFHFAKAGYVYDVLADKALGRSGSARIKVPNNAGAVLAVLPSRIRGIAVKGIPADGAVKCGADLSLDFKIDSDDVSAAYVLRVEFVSPSGEKPRFHMTRHLMTENGGVHLDFPMALDDEQGEWTVRVTEPLTGTQAEKTFTLVR